MKEKEPLSYYKWYWRDFRANRKVQRMSWQARGIYREFLDECWAEGSIPCEPSALAEIAGCTVEEMERYLPEILVCFIQESGVYYNGKIETVRTANDKIRVKRRRAGKSGGVAKSKGLNKKLASASKRKQKVANAIYADADADADADATTKTIARFTSSDIERIYQAYPRKVGKGAAFKAIQKALERIDSDAPAVLLLAATSEYAESPAGNNGEFTPHPSTWFNQSRYLDNREEWKKVR